MDNVITKLQPWATFITALLSITTLGFLLNLVRLAREAAADRVKVFEDRLEAAKEDQERTEKWQQREQERLEVEIKTKQEQLDALLQNAGLDLGSLALGSGLKAAAAGLQDQITALAKEIRSRLEALPPSIGSSQGEAKLSLAKGDLATGNWGSAAALLDQIDSKRSVTDWEYHFSRGVAHANSRDGYAADLAALRAYNDAIAYAPTTLEPNIRSRLFTYRGAMQKRLVRIDEALADLSLGRALARAPYEIRDNLYNLACVYALADDRASMMDVLKELRRAGDSLRGVRAHLHDYFLKFNSDAEFLSLIGS